MLPPPTTHLRWSAARELGGQCLPQASVVLLLCHSSSSNQQWERAGTMSDTKQEKNQREPLSFYSWKVI